MTIFDTMIAAEALPESPQRSAALAAIQRAHVARRLAPAERSHMWAQARRLVEDAQAAAAAQQAPK